MTGQKERETEKTAYSMGLWICVLFLLGMERTLLTGSQELQDRWILYGLVTVALVLFLYGIHRTKVGDWVFPVGIGGLLLLLLLQIPKVKNGSGVLANEWLFWLTGKTGQIYLDFPTEGTRGVYLTAGLLLGSLVLLAVWGAIHEKAVVFYALFVGCLLGIGSGYLRPDAGILFQVFALAGFLGYRKLEYRKAKEFLLTGAAFAGAMGLCMGAAFGVGAAMKFRVSADYLKLSATSALHRLHYDSGTNALPEGNLVNPGSFERSDETALTLTMDEPGKLYLRGMIGEIYTGSSWKSINEKNRQDGEDLFYWLHKSGFYGQTAIGQAERLQGEADAGKLHLENVSACRKHQYLPYALADKDSLNANEVGDDLNPASGKEENLALYSGSVPEWYGLALWLAANQNTSDVQEYLAQEESYRTYVYDTDLQLTNSAVGVFERIFGTEKGTKKSLTEILRMVRDTLDEQLEYREDTVTYNGRNDFLRYIFEQSKCGYSLHYATAATLMLRYFGVPARYVEGYYLPGDEAADYASGENIILSEAHAHAWTEYYLDGVGWIPFEVTPGYIDEEEEQALSRMMAEEAGDGDGKAFNQSLLTYTPPKYSEETDKISDWKEAFRFRTKGVLIAALLLLLALLLYAAYRIGRNRKRLLAFWRQMDRTENREAIQELYAYGLMLLERRDAERMGCSPEEREELRQMNQEARFSSHEQTDIMKSRMRQFAEQAAEYCKSSGGRLQRFREHYILWLYR